MGEKIKRVAFRALRVAIDAAIPAALGSVVADVANEKILGISMTVFLAGAGKLLRMLLPDKYHKYIII